MSEFDLIKNTKRANTRNILDNIRADVNTRYENYLNHFQQIHTIGDFGHTDDQKNALLKCYSGKTKARSSLILRITKAQSDELQYICAYCLYHTVSTIDHYVPKEEYPVFSVMPRNLLPCCSRCNAIKNEFWREATHERLFLHLYNDMIPNLDFLRGTLSFQNGLPVIEYQLHQPVELQNDLFAIIENHFDRLDLLKLYKEGIGIVIGETKKSVAAARAVSPNLSIGKIINVISTISDRNKVVYGNNYWQSIAMDLLAGSPAFTAML